MPTLLHIDSSPRVASVSSFLSSVFVEKWTQRNPAGRVFHHNSSHEHFPYLDEAFINASFTPEAERTAAQKAALAFSDQMVDELLAADVVALGAPMWNLSIPASLKAWIDLIVREGRTFAFTDQGVAPLVQPGKRVYVFSARGGAYPAGTPFQDCDQQEPYLRRILGVIGLTRVEFICAEHQSDGPEAAAQGLARAKSAIDALAE
ncbi:MAG: FMN-dependent NADH-azoreductase [Terracidiphilus sp.]